APLADQLAVTVETIGGEQVGTDPFAYGTKFGLPRNYTDVNLVKSITAISPLSWGFLDGNHHEFRLQLSYIPAVGLPTFTNLNLQVDTSQFQTVQVTVDVDPLSDLQPVIKSARLEISDTGRAVILAGAHLLGPDPSQPGGKVADLVVHFTAPN